jgi:hypothetical protein
MSLAIPIVHPTIKRKNKASQSTAFARFPYEFWSLVLFNICCKGVGLCLTKRME